MADVLDILELDKPQGSDKKIENIGPGDTFKKMNSSSKKKNKLDEKGNSFAFKKPEGMHREVYALLYADMKDGPPIIPTDMIPTNISKSGGYKQNRAKLGLKKVRPWRWMPFHNPGRTDNFQLFHWRRIADEGKEYPFAKFNKSVQIPTYSNNDYQHLLQNEKWTKEETDHLFNLCRRFDLRFTIIQDRWNKEKFPTKRSIEDLKERYYNVCNLLIKSRSNGQDVKIKSFDAEHERKRKEQLIKLYNRTNEQVEEEQKLLEELRKIEMRKRERDKKTQDLQNLITAADTRFQAKKQETPIVFKQGGPGRPARNAGRKKTPKLPVNATTPNTGVGGTSSAIVENAGIKFPEMKSSGPSLRSARMKLPASLGQKKTKAIEQLLLELNIELRPMPTEEICQHFNELRSDMVLLYELKSALSSCEYELQTLKHQYEALQPGKHLESLTPATTVTSSTQQSSTSTNTSSSKQMSETPLSSLNTDISSKKTISEIIETGPATPRKRRAALEQSNLMKRLKKNVMNQKCND